MKKKPEHTNMSVSENSFLEIGHNYASLKLSTEFNRQPRSFDAFDSFKATELRSFLLYGGDICLKPLVAEPVLQCFYRLMVAVRLLDSPIVSSQSCYLAKCFLESFIDNVEDVFGEHFVTIGIHLLSHLPEEVKRLGRLSSFSCFKYENVLKYIKNMQINYAKPMPSLANKMRIKSVFKSCKSRIQSEGRTFKSEFKDGPTVAELDGWAAYKTLVNDSTTYSVKAPNCHIMVNGRVVRIRNIFRGNESQCRILASSYDKQQPAFKIKTSTNDFISSQVGVYKLLKLKNELMVIDFEDITAKYVVHLTHDETEYRAYSIL
jgi:hypothetical protein